MNNVNNLSNDARQPRIMLFCVNYGGHYPSYIHHLVKYWQKNNLAGILNIVVLPQFLEQYSLLINSESENQDNNVKFINISPEEASSLVIKKTIVNQALYRLQEWKLFRHYALLLNATHGLLMILDNFQLPLALGLKSPCPVSGIYFRPSFHYEGLNSYIFSAKERLQQWREKFLLSRILRHSQLKTLFCLDPFAVKEINKVSSQPKAIYLPDPVTNAAEFKLDLDKIQDLLLKVKLNRKVFLLLGALNSRRGIYQLLEAIDLLSDELCQQLCLVLVGQAGLEKAPIESRIKEILKSKPIQIIRHYEFVSEQQVNAYYHLADVILAIHQKHIGMSGSLVLAAAAQKPVLSSNYGLVGHLVQEHKLGLAVDSTIAGEIAQGLRKFLLESPEDLCDRTKMKAFGEQNSPENFTKTIFQHLLKKI